MAGAQPPFQPAPGTYVPPPPPGPTKEEPWGTEDPMLWCAGRVRHRAILSSSVIALFILLFGAGMYSLFTTAIYGGDLEGKPGLIVLLITPLVLAIVGGALTAVLARNVGRLARQQEAPVGAYKARPLLWLSALLWFLLFFVFIGSLLYTMEPTEEGNDPFPIGIITILPAYMGLCLAVFTSGAAMAAWSERNKLEAFLVIGLGWVAFLVFLILPGMVATWDIGSGNTDIDYDQVIFWLRFGNLFPTLLPWLIVMALNWAHGRNLMLLEATAGEVPGTAGLPEVLSRGADACDRCGGTLDVHPRTQEVFCTACGAGLGHDDIVVDEVPALDMFVEQPRTPEPVHAPAPTHEVRAQAEQPPQKAVRFCSYCGGELATLSKTQQVYCTGCGAGLPGTAAQPRTPPPIQQAIPPGQAQARPQVAPAATPAPHQPARAPARGRCTSCGGALAIHPRTQELFCPACGTGLSTEPHVAWPPP